MLRVEKKVFRMWGGRRRSPGGGEREGGIQEVRREKRYPEARGARRRSPGSEDGEGCRQEVMREKVIYRR